ncbi:crotonase/enoyl-CoA hydratase family protein [Phenylobacterium aquaticum]|uniref:crotonase/enoyl-CoA hydratase family protein n=2 Tax=Phenylobacterium aquaticum TaxID=1763816 RepID=UPI0026EFEDA2|nr:crotonase/enoyl-CoA hydratase family protein [Phenylobacterium aquaticum]
MTDRIQVTITNGVADVRLVRVDKMNALDDAMFQALVDTGERLKTETGLRAIVLSGEGRAFCAGLDMGNFGKMASGERKSGESSAGGSLVTANRTDGGSNRAQHAVMVWREQPVPVIGAIHGVAFGGGFQLAIAPDIRLVAPDTKLAILEIKWGLVPDMAGMVLLKGMVRDDIARELTYTGRIFDGTEAARIGVATRTSADPRTEALALANEIAGKSPTAIRAAKRLFAVQAHATQRELLEAESAEQTALISSPNQVEAVLSNMQKRAAVYAD